MYLPRSIPREKTSFFLTSLNTYIIIICKKKTAHFHPVVFDLRNAFDFMRVCIRFDVALSFPSSSSRAKSTTSSSMCTFVTCGMIRTCASSPTPISWYFVLSATEGRGTRMFSICRAQATPAFLFVKKKKKREYDDVQPLQQYIVNI